MHELRAHFVPETATFSLSILIHSDEIRQAIYELLTITIIFLKGDSPRQLKFGMSTWVLHRMAMKGGGGLLLVKR